MCPALSVPSLHYRGIDGAGAACCIHKSSPVSCTSPESHQLREVVQPLQKHPTPAAAAHTQHNLLPQIHSISEVTLSHSLLFLFLLPVVRSLSRTELCQITAARDSEPITAQMMRMGMQQHSHSFLVLLLVVFVAGIVLSGPSTPRRSRGRCHCPPLTHPHQETLLIACEVMHLMHAPMSGHHGLLCSWVSPPQPEIHASESEHQCDCLPVLALR